MSNKKRQKLLQYLENQERVEAFETIFASSNDDSSDGEIDKSSTDTADSLAGTSTSADSTETSSSKSDNEWTSAGFIEAAIQGQQYLSVRKNVPKNQDFVRALLKMDKDRFRQEIRMSRSAFDQLLDLIHLN